MIDDGFWMMDFGLEKSIKQHPFCHREARSNDAISLETLTSGDS